MNTKHQNLITRLKRALDNISENPKTEAVVELLLTELVVSFEEIVSDLKQTSDQETATVLESIIKAAPQTESSVDQVMISVGDALRDSLNLIN